ncbi:hypothetical protein IV203_023625 [Nitzschia inconspicua]|uniref:Uncharacterized protein n=1 Tax=Nitzschia inconspicua TaxID=303405 RepID=A0A9K3KDE8_9STRA|nr:hypothetical protein IV203_023625 [Nitzschia inconspicua]
MNIHFIPPEPRSGLEPRPINHETIESGDAFVEDVSSVMQDMDDDDDDQDVANDYYHPNHFHTSNSSSSGSSTSSASLTPIDWTLHFERAMEQARQVVFTPHTTVPKVHEFDWKVVNFQPTPAAGHKRKSMDEDVNMADAFTSGGTRSFNNKPESGMCSVNTSASSSPSEQSKRRRFWKGSSTRLNKERSNSFIGNSSICSSQSSQFSNRALSSSSAIHARQGFSFRGLLGSSSTTQQQQQQPYIRPVKRTRIESTYHLGPSAEHGILKNRTTPPDAVSSTLVTTITSSGQSNFPTIVTPPQGQKRRKMTTTKKRIRFVDSRMKVVKRLQAGNLFSFGQETARYEVLSEEDDNDNQERMVERDYSYFNAGNYPFFQAASPNPTARTARRLQTGTFSSDKMSEL